MLESFKKGFPKGLANALKGLKNFQKTPIGGFLYFVIILLIIKLFFVDAYNIPSRSMEPTLIQGDFILTNKLVYKLTDPRRGDIVVFIFPKPELFGKKLVKTPILRDFLNINFIKRVVGLPGDVISFNNGRLTINGKPLRYEFVREDNSTEVYYEYIPRGDKYVRHPVRYWKKINSFGRLLGRYGVLKEAIKDFPSACLETKRICAYNSWGVERCAEVCSKIRVPKGYYFVMGDNRDDSEDGRYWGFLKREYILSTPFVIFFSGKVPHLSVQNNNPLSGFVQLLHALTHPYWSRIGKPLIY